MSAREPNHFACAEVLEFEAYRGHAVYKDALLAETDGEREAFIARAARTIDECVLRTPAHARGNTDDLLAKLHRRGYHHQDIVQALAAAWYDDAETFDLPPLSRRRFLHSGWFLIGVPVVIALVTLLVGMEVMMHVDPGKMGYFAKFPPLLAMIGFVIAAVLHMGLKAVVALVDRLGGDR